MLNLFKNRIKYKASSSKILYTREDPHHTTIHTIKKDTDTTKDRNPINVTLVNDMSRINNSINTDYVPASKEWFNSIYTYNKNYTKTLPIADKLTNKLINMYFNLRIKESKKKSSRIQIRNKRLSLNRIMVSKAEMKHVNNKVVITVYVFNKNKQFLMYKLKELYKNFQIGANKAVKLARKIRGKISKAVNKVGFQFINKKFILLHTDSKNVTNIRKLPKFSSKRFSFKGKNRKGYIPKRKIKINRYLYYNEITKIDLSRFIIRLGKKKTNYPAMAFLSNKYRNLIRKYYFLLDNENINNMKKDYFLNFVNLGKDKSSAINTEDLTKAFSIRSKISDSYCKLSKYPNLTLQLRRNIGKKKAVRKTRSLKNFMHKLRNIHKLFFLSEIKGNISNKDGITMSQSSSAKLELLAPKQKNFLVKNLDRILKKKSTVKKVMNLISLRGLRIVKKAKRNKNFLLKTLEWKKENFLSYETKYYKEFINKAYNKETLYLYYVKLLTLNNNIFKNWFLLGLKNVISKIYQKKVEFNFVNLKYLHLNSDIFSESISIKLKNRDNSLLHVLNKALVLVKLPSLALNKRSLSSNSKETTNLNPVNLNKEDVALKKGLDSFLSLSSDKDLLQEILHNNSPLLMGKIENSLYTQKGNSLQENILHSTKYKNTYGVRLEARGRLTKRLTASRTLFKLKYKGSLKNIDSSYKGLSSVVLRGIGKSNIMSTKIADNTRNGSYGLKTWISTH